MTFINFPNKQMAEINTLKMIYEAFPYNAMLNTFYNIYVSSDAFRSAA